MEELDPQLSPEEAESGQDTETGQGASAEPTEAAPSAEQQLRERLEALERANKEAQRKITKQGQELSKYRNVTNTGGNGNDTPEDLWTNPDAYFERKLSPLYQYIQRQEANETLARMAKERGVDPSVLSREFERFQSALNDPDEMADILSDVVRSRDVASQVEQAKKVVQGNVEKNARAVTAESESTHVPPPGKKFDEMTLQEQRDYIVQKYGIAPEY